jgi:hypothetical protein
MNAPITTRSSVPGRKGKVAWLALIPALGLLCWTAISPALPGEPSVGIGGAGPEGSWLGSITTPDGKTWEVPMSYCAGGAMVVSDPTLIGLATAYHGTWMQTGRREFTYTMVGFINNTVLDVLPKGMTKVVIKETNTIELDGNTYNGSGSFELYSLDGTRLVYRPVVPSHAVRIQAE